MKEIGDIERIKNMLIQKALINYIKDNDIDVDKLQYRINKNGLTGIFAHGEELIIKWYYEISGNEYELHYESEYI